jgi:hypothetical protein
MRSVPHTDTRGEESDFTECEAIETDASWFSQRDSEFARGIHSQTHLACDGLFTREIAETKPFADVVRIRQKLILIERE